LAKVFHGKSEDRKAKVNTLTFYSMSVFEGFGVKVEQSSWNQLSQFIADAFRDYIRNNARATGNLVDSIRAVPEIRNNEVQITLTAEDRLEGGGTYYFFVDEGVNAIPFVPEYNYTRPRVDSAPFSFRTLGVPEQFARTLMQSYVVDMPTAYGIATNIKKHGIAPRNITVNVMTDAFVEEIGNKAADIMGNSLDDIFNEIFVSWQSR
jgi:hypothetical protein